MGSFYSMVTNCFNKDNEAYVSNDDEITDRDRKYANTSQRTFAEITIKSENEFLIQNRKAFQKHFVQGILEV